MGTRFMKVQNADTTSLSQSSLSLPSIAFTPVVRFFIGFSLIALSGCSLWGSEQKAGEESAKVAPQPQTGGQVVTSLEESAFAKTAPAPQTIAVVNITWQRPQEAVTAYYLNYGYETGKLTNRVKVPVTELEKADDPRFGPVYRHRLTGVAADKKIFVTLQAENDQGISPPTAEMIVQPD